MKELNERQIHQEVALDSFKLYQAEDGTFKANSSQVNLLKNFELNRAVGEGFLFCIAFFFALISKKKKATISYSFPPFNIVQYIAL